MAELKIEQPHEHVRVLCMCRAQKRNAPSLTMISAMREQVHLAEQEGTRALVIAGEGAVFSAGADFSDLKGDLSDLDFDARMFELTQHIRKSDLITFAAIQGGCIGAGLDLAMACDFRVAAPDAFFALPALQMGILYNPDSLSLMLPGIQPAIARRLLLLAERIGREEAHQAGIVTHLAQGEGEGSVVGLATLLAAQSALLPCQAQRTTKSFIAALERGDTCPSLWQSKREALLMSKDRQTALMGKRN